MINITLQKNLPGKLYLIGMLFLSLFLISILVLPAAAASTATVNATVTVQNVSVAVSDGTVTYGTIGTSSNADTTSNGINDSQTAQNDGNVTEDFNIRGQDTANWTLAGSVGSNQYKHDFCTSTCDSSPTWTALTTNYQTLSSDVSASGTQVFDLRLNTPSSSSSFSQQSANVTVQAVAS